MKEEQRVIKFRAWFERNKQMLYKDLFDKNWYATPTNDEGGCHTVREAHFSDKSHMAIMQYTGLKGKNGVEIYEGDIFAYVSHSKIHRPPINPAIYGVVVYLPFGGFCGHIVGSDKPNSLINPSVYEVIGNIYENKELLK